MPLIYCNTFDFYLSFNIPDFIFSFVDDFFSEILNMQNLYQQQTAQILFQKLTQDHLKQIQLLKPQSECSFNLDQIVDISDLKSLNQGLKSDQTFYFQIRGNHVLQVVKKQLLKSNKKVIKDQIISGFEINLTIRFQIKRQHQLEHEPLSKPIGLIFYFDQNSFPLQFVTQQSAEKIEQFGKTLQSKFLVQRNFHKIFKPIKKLGKGASSTVIEGQDLRNNTTYAVKGFKKSKGFFIQKGIFYKQLQFLKQIQHHQIVKLNSIFQTQNSLYMVLDKYNQNLYDFITSKGLNTEYELKAIIKGILQTLQFLHSRNIMHRDIKPENIMIKEGVFQKKQLSKRKTNIQPVLIDFGFAQYQTNQQFTLYRCGTPGFIGPQIMRDYLISQEGKDSFNSQVSNCKKKYTKSCDIFSLGCVFHILLTNKMAFQGKDKKQLIKNNIQCIINTSAKQYKILDVNAKKLLFRMLQKDPEKRISASQALKDDFFRLEMFNFRPIKFANALCSKISNSQLDEKSDRQLFLFQ